MTMERVRDFETRHAVSLPLDYSGFLALHVDPFAIHGRIRVAKTELRKLFSVFSPSYTDGLDARFEMYRSRIPPGFVPIGVDSFSNLFCLGAVGTDYESKIYFWDHELEADDDETPTLENMTFIANSFTEFLAVVERE